MIKGKGGDKPKTPSRGIAMVFRVYMPAKGGRSCERFGGYKDYKPNTFISHHL